MMTLSEPIEGRGGCGGAGPRSTPTTRTTAAPEVDDRAVRIGAISTAADLAASFRLRHEVYRALGYVAAGESGMDVDPYDACSLPIGAFDVRSGMLVGAMRVISERAGRGRRGLVEVAVGDRGVVWRRRDPVLPSLVSPEIRMLIAREAGDGLPIRELSRCVVAPAWRGRGIVHDLVRFGMALAWRDRPALLVGACLPEHVPMYARHGFRPLREDGQTDFFPAVGRRGCVLVRAPRDAATPHATPTQATGETR